MKEEDQVKKIAEFKERFSTIKKGRPLTVH